MQMPQPTEAHRRLQAFVGDWQGEETLFPSPWSPEERTSVGRFSARMGVDGMFLVSDYEEEREGKIFFRGHGVYGYDVARSLFTMFWFDSMGMSPNETLGSWEGDTLTFENEGEQGRARYVYALEGDDRYTFSIMTSRDGVEWSKMMQGTYRRSGGL